MSIFAAIRRETVFMLRDKAVLALAAVVLVLSTYAVVSGMEEVEEQRATIEQLIEADRADRQAAQAKQDSWGGAAYYSFHLTYDPPSDFAFTALGQRDAMPWKHRVRMLALEGQIHESDPANPVFALTGRLDFAFLLAFILPLVLIVLLHDLRAGERSAGRYELLCASTGRTAGFWALRAGLRTTLIALCALLPLLIGGWFAGAGVGTLLAGAGIALVYLAFWAAVSSRFAAWSQSGPLILISLIGLWALLAVLLPAGGKLLVDRLIPVPSGAEIIMTQREAVNDAWDLPKEETMTPFVERHPEWAEYTQVERFFEWKWYYAFQQVGDQKAEALSKAYREGVLRRDIWAARLSWLSPPALVERAFQVMAETDTRSALAYDEAVRDFHAELRDYYYPEVFRETLFSREKLDDLPVFQPEKGIDREL